MTLIQGKDVFQLAANAGLTAAAAALMNHPIGAVGGAIYGACATVTNFCSRWVVNKIIDKDVPLVSDICAIAISTFAALKAAELFGVTLTLKSAFVLCAATVGVTLATMLFVAVAGTCCYVGAAAAVAGASSR
jgi:ABC-type antimicrobial peptide transport system permease subunit